MDYTVNSYNDIDDNVKAVFLDSYRAGRKVSLPTTYEYARETKMGIENSYEYAYKMVEEEYLEKADNGVALNVYSYGMLQDLLRARGLANDGKKADLINRLAEYSEATGNWPPIPEEVFILTEKGSDFVSQHEAYVKVYTHPDRGVTWSEYQALGDPNLSYSANMLKILGKCLGLEDGRKKRETALILYEVLAEQQNFSDAVEMLLRVLYYDCNAETTSDYVNSIFAPSSSDKYIEDKFYDVIKIEDKLLRLVNKYKDYVYLEIIDELYLNKTTFQFCKKDVFKRIIKKAVEGEYYIEPEIAQIRIEYMRKISLR